MRIWILICYDQWALDSGRRSAHEKLGSASAESRHQRSALSHHGIARVATIKLQRREQRGKWALWSSEMPG